MKLGGYLLFIAALLGGALYLFLKHNSPPTGVAKVMEEGQSQNPGPDIQGAPAQSIKPSARTDKSQDPMTISSDRPSETNVATSEFQAARICHLATREVQRLQGQIDACGYNPERWTPSELAQCRESARSTQAKIDKILLEKTNCDPNPAQQEWSYAKALTKAAELGDTFAQICYIRGDFTYGTDEPGDLGYKENLDRHESIAQAYIATAFARGDWRVVQLLASGEMGQSNGGITGQRVKGYDDYRMNRLQRLAANEEFARKLDNSAANIRVSPEQIEAANAWAKTVYAKYFINSSILTDEKLDTCADP